VKDWDKDPVIQNTEVSFDLPLVELIPLVPWKSLGENADAIRYRLEGGGKIKANNVVLPDMVLSEFPPNADQMLSGIDMVAQLIGITVQPFPKGLKLENINGTVQLENGIAQLSGFVSKPIRFRKPA
jgi:hypothetical protein